MRGAEPGVATEEAARLAARVQDLGFEAARAVVGRFAELFEAYRAGSAGAASGARWAVDGYLDLIRRVDDRIGEQQPEGALVVPDVAAGGRSSSRLWLHNGTSSVATDLRPWVPLLVTHAGDQLSGDTVSFAPERVGHLGAGASGEVVAVVAPPDGAPGGTYHGLVLVDGLPDSALALTVRVVARVVDR